MSEKRFTENHDFLETARGDVRRLASVTRWGNTPTAGRTEDVASHSYYVALYAYAIAQHIDAELPEVRIDVGQVLKQAIMHDIEEAIVDDITVNTQVTCPEAKELKDRLSVAGRHAIMNTFPDTPSTLNLEVAAEIAKGVSVEGRVVRVADYLAAWAYCWDQIDMGNVFNYHPMLRNSIDKLFVAVEALAEVSEDLRDCVGKFLGDETKLWTRENVIRTDYAHPGNVRG